MCGTPRLELPQLFQRQSQGCQAIQLRRCGYTSAPLHKEILIFVLVMPQSMQETLGYGEAARRVRVEASSPRQVAVELASAAGFLTCHLAIVEPSNSRDCWSLCSNCCICKAMASSGCIPKATIRRNL